MVLCTTVVLLKSLKNVLCLMTARITVDTFQEVFSEDTVECAGCRLSESQHTLARTLALTSPVLISWNPACVCCALAFLQGHWKDLAPGCQMMPRL